MEVSQRSQSTLPDINPSYPINHEPLKTVHFDPNCKKCHGTGLKRNYCWMNGLLFKKIPCTACYKASDVCYRCKGRQVNKKGEPCRKCMTKSTRQE